MSDRPPTSPAHKRSGERQAGGMLGWGWYEQRGQSGLKEDTPDGRMLLPVPLCLLKGAPSHPL